MNPVRESGRPFAVFDIDGTIIRWQLFHAIVDALGKQGELPAKDYKRLQDAMQQWETRTQEESFSAFEHRSVDIFTSILNGLEVATHTHAAQQMFEEHKDKVYRYTRALIKELKAKNYVLFAISGSPTEAVKPFAQYYGFDDFAASQYKHNGKTYTGEVVSFVGKKDKALKELVQKHSLDFAGSIGVGDSEGDIAMLELVENPIAFNPSKKLFAHAKSQAWHIIVERKNVVYELSEQDGVYVLED